MRRIPCIRAVLGGILAVIFIVYFFRYVDFFSDASKLGLQKYHMDMQDFAHLRHTGAKPEQSSSRRDGFPSQDKKFSRSNKHCNTPLLPVAGKEGHVTSNLTLELLAILIRHGDRSPMAGFPGLPKHNLNCQLNAHVYENHSNIEAMIRELLRQERQRKSTDPFIAFPVFPKSKHCGFAQLTSHGTVQHLNIGAFLKKQYVERHNLLNHNFSHRELALKCTKYTRTYQSAIAFMYGFLPKFEIKNLHFQPVGLSFCPSSFHPSGCNCNLQVRLQHMIQEEMKAAGGNAWAEGFRQAIADLGIQAKPSLSASMIDVLMGRFCHGRAIPCAGKQKQCDEASILQGLWDILDRNGRFQQQSPSLQKSHRLLMHPMLWEITTVMEQRMLKKTELKLLFYSGHDTTVSSLITALGISNGHWPPYASRVIFELYSKNLNSLKEFFISVLYNGGEMTEKVRFCRGHTQNGLCPLERLIKFTRTESLKELFGVEKYAEACNGVF